MSDASTVITNGPEGDYITGDQGDNTFEVQRPAWQQRAACRGTLLGYSELHSEQERFIIDYCLSCPVKQECGDWGIEHEAHGIWGGMRPKTRGEIRKQQRIELRLPEVNHRTGVVLGTEKTHRTPS